MDCDDETLLDYFILRNIYLDLCYNVVNDCVLEYDQNYIYLSTIPDFVDGYESKFINHTSKEYISFINDKIQHYIDNKNLYRHKPSIIVLLKIIDTFDREQRDDELIILYNITLNMIKYMTPAYLFINEEYVKSDNGYYCITHRNVKESSIIQVYENLPLLEDFKNFLKVIFRQNIENRDLLKSELEFIDNNYDLTDNKYDDLKNSIFLSALYTIKNNIDLSYLFCNDSPPQETSIRYYIYKALENKKCISNI
jgi:hypothetical protein